MARTIDMWRRHSHPLSGWTRSLTQPLLCLPLWNRSWAQAGALAAWLAVNPVLFPPPPDDQAWMTRGILGEQLWVAELTRQIKAGRLPVRDPALWLDVGQSVLLNTSFYFAWRRRRVPMAVLNLGAVACNLGYLGRMAAFYDRRKVA